MKVQEAGQHEGREDQKVSKNQIHTSNQVQWKSEVGKYVHVFKSKESLESTVLYPYTEKWHSNTVYFVTYSYPNGQI